MIPTTSGLHFQLMKASFAVNFSLSTSSSLFQVVPIIHLFMCCRCLALEGLSYHLCVRIQYVSLNLYAGFCYFNARELSSCLCIRKQICRPPYWLQLAITGSYASSGVINILHHHIFLKTMSNWWSKALQYGGVHPCLGLSIVEVVIYLEYATFLSFIHHFPTFFVEFVMFPSISDIQPKRVSQGDNIHWRRCQGEDNRSSASLGE